MFCVTACSTTAVGMRYMYNFKLGLAPLSSDGDILPFAWVLDNLRDFSQGLPFSLTLVAILLAHEFGHYFACRAYGVSASLPYLLPAPSLSGTFGAVIRLRSQVSSRAALIVIGAMGPIAGFLVSVIAVAFGLSLSRYSSVPVLHRVESPLVISGLHAMLGALHAGEGTHSLALLIPHPVLVASWIGILVTALNLVPAGQLDGGHILYAVAPALHMTVTRIITVALLVMGIYGWCGWLLWGLILLLPGMRHPKVQGHDRIKPWHYALLPVCLVILILTATPQPFPGYSLLGLLHKL